MKTNIPYIKKEQKKIASLVTKQFKHYYLTGGTALSFTFDHRFSEDLDFFTQKYKKDETEKIMDFISQKTGYSFELSEEQDKPKLVPMKVYYLQLTNNIGLKIDFVQDFLENIKKIKNGLHSVEDIYYRKVFITVGAKEKESSIGRLLSTGRQTVKDLYDLYYLSKHHKTLSDFFFDYFSYDKAERLIAWFRSFNRMQIKTELLDLVPEVDTGEVLDHLDREILKRIPDKLVS